MTLQTAIEIGAACNLETVGEALYNISLRAGQIFDYNEINQELKELRDEFSSLNESGLLSKETSVENAQQLLKDLEENK